MEILVASTSKQKLPAVEAAAHALYPDQNVIVRGVPAQSEINEQPFGLEETKLGAENRLKNALAANGSAPYDKVVSIENGIFPEGAGQNWKYIDKAVVIVQDKDGERVTHISPGVEFPKDTVEELLKQPDGFKKRTVGSLLHERNPAISDTDPHSFLTGGEHSRMDLLTSTIRAALETLRTRE